METCGVTVLKEITVPATVWPGIRSLHEELSKLPEEARAQRLVQLVEGNPGEGMLFFGGQLSLTESVNLVIRLLDDLEHAGSGELGELELAYARVDGLQGVSPSHPLWVDLADFSEDSPPAA